MPRHGEARQGRARRGEDKFPQFFPKTADHSPISERTQARMTGVTLTNVDPKAAATIVPYRAEVTIKGTRPILFHRYNVDAIAIKAGEKKGSKAKKSDDIETYVYLTEDGKLAVPGINFHSALVAAAKFKSDPRSPRASAKELFKCGVIPTDDLVPFGSGVANWDFIDRRRVRVQNSYITRERPGLAKDWELTFGVDVSLPEYITPDFLLDVANDAGRFCGLCDFRPIFGRFQVSGFRVVDGD